MRIVLIASVALALAGCSKSGGSGNNSSGAAAATQEQQPANLTEDPENQMVPVAAPSPVAASGLPKDFLGRWGLTGQDCRRTPAPVEEGLMTVSADALTFYESHATIAKADTSRPGSLSVKLDYTGEGKRWSDDEVLTLVDPQTLVREVKRPVGSFRYSRCPK